jgi:hypothetical protein
LHFPRDRLEIPGRGAISGNNCANGTVPAMWWVTNEPNRRTKMTATTNSTAATQTTDKTQTPLSRDEVKKMLRDAAFVLQMTRRVKAEMVAERAEAGNPATRKPQEVAAGLGV